MKPGDTFWIYTQTAGDKIFECVAIDVDHCSVAYQILGKYRERPYIALLADCFPTRETLCEHYRKIFE